MLIPRTAINREVRLHLEVFPAAGLVGARQVGKTTLAKSVVENAQSKRLYLDLQQPSARAQLQDAESYLRSRSDHLVILDEVQTMPDLFPTLRSTIDEDRRPGRFLLLGSAAPELLRSTAESLAGRIVYTELHGLALQELPVQASIDEHWLRGGFPFAYQLKNATYRTAYFNSYVQTFVGTDLRDLAGGSDPAGMRRLIIMLAHLQGTTLNFSNLGRSLEVSYKTVQRYLDILESAFLIRRLRPFLPNLKKRLTKSPKIFLRDSGLVHGLLNISSIDRLLAHPVVGGSWEGYVIEQILAAVVISTQSYHYRSVQGHEIDLVLVFPNGETTAIEIKRSNAPTLSPSFYVAVSDVAANKTYVVTPSSPRYPVANNVEVIGLRDLIKVVRPGE